MAIKKKYLKSGEVKVTFSVPSDIGHEAETAHVVGEFNGWNIYQTPMKKNKNGTFSVTLTLEGGRQYQFRYLLDQTRWHNDQNADEYVPTPFGSVENSVLRT